jgi:TonB family protein
LSSHQLPTPPENSKAPSVVVDLLINERGTVESVKLVTPPTDMRQRMLISALKAWQYQPALKDGRPVRFLHRVKVTP